MQRRKFIQLSAVAGSTLASWGFMPMSNGTLSKLSMSDSEQKLLKAYQQQFADAPFASELSYPQTQREIQPRRILKFENQSSNTPFSYVNGNGKTVTLRQIKGNVVATIR